MIALLHADGSLPNLALMRLGTHFRERGETVRLVRIGDKRDLFDGAVRAFGSSVFTDEPGSRKTRDWLSREWGPDVTWGGTGVRVESSLSEIEARDWERVPLDYSLYPEFGSSIGFTQRGCRLSCSFCVVPKKEGKPTGAGTIAEIWRGKGHPKRLILLDNDTFGAPEWRDRFAEIRAGDFRVSFAQGVNIRLVDEESARALASIRYRDVSFTRSRLYCAWDNLGDEEVFMAGARLLQAAGIPGKHLMVYMLVGFDRRERPEEDGSVRAETWERILYRFNALVALGARPYPMVFERYRPHMRQLRAFQRWANRGLYRAVAWADYRDPRLDRERAST